IRESKVYCEIQPFNLPLEKITALKPEGIVLSGGPASVYQENAPKIPPDLFYGFARSDRTRVWMSHGDKMTSFPRGWKVLAHSGNSPIAAFADPTRRFFGVQFHPEVAHTARGRELLENFTFRICGCRPDWTMEHFIDTSVRQIREKVGDGRVLCALSGGVDSAVAATLLHRAIK